MRLRALIIAQISLFLMLSFATTALGSSPSSESPSSASVSTDAQDEAPIADPADSAQNVETAMRPIPGCKPAKQKGPWAVPADGGKAIRTFPGPYILQPWWNNGNPSVLGQWWNPGEPPWGQVQVKVMIPLGVTIETHGIGGVGWDYVPACQKRLSREFRNAPELRAVKLWELIELGLAVRKN